jgi:hypothetical protein
MSLCRSPPPGPSARARSFSPRLFPRRACCLPRCPAPPARPARPAPCSWRCGASSAARTRLGSAHPVSAARQRQHPVSAARTRSRRRRQPPRRRPGVRGPPPAPPQSLWRSCHPLPPKGGCGPANPYSGGQGYWTGGGLGQRRARVHGRRRARPGMPDERETRTDGPEHGPGPPRPVQPPPGTSGAPPPPATTAPTPRRAPAPPPRSPVVAERPMHPRPARRPPPPPPPAIRAANAARPYGLPLTPRAEAGGGSGGCCCYPIRVKAGRLAGRGGRRRRGGRGGGGEERLAGGGAQRRRRPRRPTEPQPSPSAPAERPAMAPSGPYRPPAHAPAPA